jgi:hypothetical protein
MRLTLVSWCQRQDLRQTYIWVVAERLKRVGINGGGEAVEDGLEDVLGGLAQDAQGAIEGGQSAGVFELDNVLIGDESAGVTPGNQERSRLGTLGGGGHCHGQDGEEDRQTHDGCFEGEVDEMKGCMATTWSLD